MSLAQRLGFKFESEYTECRVLHKSIVIETWKRIDWFHAFVNYLFPCCTTILGGLFGPNPSLLSTRPPDRNIEEDRL